MTLLRSFALVLLLAVSLAAQWGGELRIALRSEPRTFNPVLVEDTDSETVRYLTGGVLIRVHRLAQRLQPELATSWKVDRGGRRIAFKLREGVRFSDGTPFTSDDVVYTIERLMDPNVHSATGDGFRVGTGTVRAVAHGPLAVEIEFPEPIAGLERLFDQVAILSRNSPRKELATLGPFTVGEHKPGSSLVLTRNPNYWKTQNGRRLPYLDAIRIEIQKNRELELMKFRRGQLDLISQVDPDQFVPLETEDRTAAVDAGLTNEGEMLWFNMTANAPMPAYRKAWFQARGFRLAVSHAIHRDDIARVVYRGHADPAAGPFSKANLVWFNAKLHPHEFDLNLARKLLADDGFRLDGKTLRDRAGNAVEFSLITNAGNRARERIAAMLQQDLAAIGIKLNIVTLDFPSLMERITKSYNYEACLLGMNNVDLDPNGQLNVWLSSSANHQWNPKQAAPATPWEAAIDHQMKLQASTLDPAKRKAAFDKVQQIASEQAPFVYLVNRHALVAVGRAVRNAQPSALRPQLLWNVEYLAVDRAK